MKSVVMADMVPRYVAFAVTGKLAAHSGWRPFANNGGVDVAPAVGSHAAAGLPGYRQLLILTPIKSPVVLR